MTTISVKYIGHKVAKDDNIAESGLVWRGHGDVQDVTPAQWSKLSKHRDVWARVDAAAPPITLSATPPVSLSPVGSVVVTDTKPAPMVPAIALPVVDQAVAAAPVVSQVTEQVPPVQIQGLLGSDVLDSIIDIGGAPVQLGTIVAAAYTASGLSVDDWNGLVPQIRDQLLSDQIAAMRLQATPDSTQSADPAAAAGAGAGDQGDAGTQDAAAPKATRTRRAAMPPTGEVS